MYNPDTQFNFLSNLDIDNISNLCLVNPSFKNICYDPYFWKVYFKKHPLPDIMYTLPSLWIKSFNKTKQTLTLLDYITLPSTDLYAVPKLEIDMFLVAPELIINVIDDPAVFKFLNRYQTLNPNEYEYNMYIEKSFDNYKISFDIQAYIEDIDGMFIYVDENTLFHLLYNLTMNDIPIFKLK